MIDCLMEDEFFFQKSDILFIELPLAEIISKIHK